MFDYLKELDEGIYSRYLTVMRNIRSSSNSFYDSFLDLQEETIKSIADFYGFQYEDNITCGLLIKKPEMKEILVGKLAIDEYTYGKFSDYSQKINKHKHKLEKNVSIDAVLNYMKVFYKLVTAFAKAKGLDTSETFDDFYFISEFGKAEKENRQLKDEAEILKTELLAAAKDNQLSQINIQKLQSIINQSKQYSTDLEEENLLLTTEISHLKDIKMNSLETKLDKTITMLNDLQDYLVESRIATSYVAKMICGKPISDEELREERRKLEATKNGR